jgi:heme A synthase
MTRRFTTLAWSAAVCTYLLIILGGIVRITGSGMGCGDHWPLCNGHLFPPLSDIGTVIEWSHRLVAALVSVLVVALAALAVVDWWENSRGRFVHPQGLEHLLPHSPQLGCSFYRSSSAQSP